MAGQQTYRVHTDQGDYEVTVEIPDPAPVPVPTTGGMAQNAVSSAVNVAKGTAAGLKQAVSQSPVTTLEDFGLGLYHRAKDYASDMHPIEAFTHLTDPPVNGMSSGGGVRALSNLLPVGLAYKDPVGVGLDVSGAEGAIKGASGIADLAKRVAGKGPLEPRLGAMLEDLRAKPGSPTLVKSSPAPAFGTGEGAVYHGGTGSFSPERDMPGLVRPAETGTVEGAINDILRSHMEPGSVELAASHPSGGGFTTPVESPHAGGRLVPGTAPSLEDTLHQILTETSRPEGPRAVSLPPPSDVAGPGREPFGTTSGRPSTVRSVESIGTPPVSDARMDELVNHFGGRAETPAVTAEPEPTLADHRRYGGSKRAAQDPRFQEFAREWGLPPTASTVEDLTGGPSRVPLSLEEGEGAQNLRPGEHLTPVDTRQGPSIEGLDQGFRRRIMDERGFLDPQLVKDLPKLLEALIVGYGAAKTGVPSAALRMGLRAAPYAPRAAAVATAPRLLASH